MLDHIGLEVSDLARSRAFYRHALAPLGYDVVMEFEGVIGLGAAGKPDFWLTAGARTAPKLHVAFAAAHRSLVDDFHRAALEAGGVDNGAPGIRAHYHPNYYGAFVFDPDGHNIEAVCHTPE